LPDGRHFLVSKRDDPALYVASLDGTGIQSLNEEGSRPVYAAQHLLFFRGANVFARPFDAARLAFTGSEHLLATGAAYLSASDNGTIVYRRARAALSRLAWVDRHGNRTSVAVEPAYYAQVVLSPRGDRATLVRGDGHDGSKRDLWDVVLATGVSSRLTTGAGSESDPAWSPGERRIAFTSASGVAVKDLASGADEPLVVWKDRPLVVDQWTPDDQFIIARNAGQSIWAIPVEGAHTPRLLVDTLSIKDEVHVSPDGRWVAYDADESGRWEVFVADFPAFTSKRQISNDGGVQPQWSGDGRELFYLASNGTMMSALVRESAARAPSPLFATRIWPTPHEPQYAVTPDGQRFLALEPVEAERNTLTFLLNALNAPTTGK
jgi:dipeptidyl aminopeptidase/acylaminoacyl peptidase